MLKCDESRTELDRITVEKRHYNHRRMSLWSPSRRHVRARTVVGDRVLDQRLKDCSIHISKLFDVEAALPCRVSPELGQEGFCLTVVHHAVQNRGGLTR